MVTFSMTDVPNLLTNLNLTKHFMHVIIFKPYPNNISWKLWSPSYVCFYLFLWYLYDFCSHSVNTVYWFGWIILYLHPSDKAHLIMVHNPLTVLWNLACQYFIQYFYISAHQIYWHIIFFSYTIYHLNKLFRFILPNFVVYNWGTRDKN